jgi:hypothetical protein
MFRLDNFYTPLIWIFLMSIIAPASAHNIKVSGDVAATFHIEPNHNPKAGEPAQAWFALTHKGGTLIPLAQCDCKLVVHAEPHKEGDSPLLEPVLKSISTKQYQGIPGAEITFPKSGEYELELSGKPKAGAKFQAFELSYEVTALAGAASTTNPPTEMNHSHDHTEVSPSPKKIAASSSPTTQWPIPLIIGGAILGIGTLGFAIQRLRAKRT